MKIGLMVLFSDLSHLPQNQMFSEILEEIDYAEELGFDSAWVSDHHYATPGIIGNPLLLASVISQCIKQIKLVPRQSCYRSSTRFELLKMPR
jgi:alkanesulfonate monooxygenase SsuD/methylene tetrahydromethanopterin reductase-like flavin-dependent oxidoreductase (luciferase family)